MNIEKLIKSYQEKVNAKDKVISKIESMISDARNDIDTNLDVEDLKIEKQNANRDRQLYFQFVKDLEDLL